MKTVNAKFSKTRQINGIRFLIHQKITVYFKQKTRHTRASKPHIAMDMNPIIFAIPIFFLLILIELVYDQISEKKHYRLSDAVANIGCGIVEQTTGLFAKVFTVAAYHVAFTYFRFFDLDPAYFGLWFALCFIGQDFLYYWAHRMSHEVNLFWTGHAIHHQSEDYNLSVALRQGALQKVYTFYFYIPLALLGFKTEWFLLVGAINLLYQFWIHTEAIGKMWRPFEFIFNTPSHHRVHHGRNEKYIDKNHGGTFIFWDRLFGTFQEEEERPVYGVTSPVNSFNPVYAHFIPLKNLWHDLLRVKGFSNKAKLLFFKPGWLPQELGGLRPIPEVSRETYQKFRAEVPQGLNYYLLFHFTCLLAATAVFLFSTANMETAQMAVYAGAVIGSIAILGMLFDRTALATYLEASRLFATLALVHWAFGDSALQPWLSSGVSLWALGSCIWLVSANKTAQPPSGIESTNPKATAETV